ncbi:hypothetical protein JNW90_29350 [Micromonospora sp. STR1s_5]|nr:hypothetical protein [Micromonospora sp. STR1s_5]
MTAPADVARFLADEATATLGRVRSHWPLLSEARWPGSAGPRVQRYMSPQQHLDEAYNTRRDRAAAFEAVRAGRVPSGPKPAPARVGIVSVRSTVATDLRRLADRLAEGVLGTRVTVHLPDAAPCTWCLGTGEALMPAGWIPWAWPDKAVPCSRCGGHGYACTVCAAVASCGCDRSDVVVTAALAVVAAALPLVDHPDRAADACRVLDRSDKAIRRTLGLAEDYRRLPIACPACGYRDLCAEVSSPNREEWSVHCGATSCTCKGYACGCGKQARYRGRLHRWPWREFGDLAERLGVDLPVLRGLREAS